jgi:hypothetical protein
MKRNLYTVTVGSNSLVAAEIDDRQAAVLLDEGHTVHLATQSELARLAREKSRVLVLLVPAETPIAGRVAPQSETVRPMCEMPTLRLATA